MKKEDAMKLFEIDNFLDLPQVIMDLIIGDEKERDLLYMKLLKFKDGNVSYDWFQNVYMEELAERVKNKQEFTPDSVGILMSRIIDAHKGSTHEPTAGTGGTIIADWWQRCLKVYPWQYKPSDYIVSCWELSSRSIPILLLNLSIRGIMGEVIHGDVLEQSVKARYVLINENNNPIEFSKIIKC